MLSQSEQVKFSRQIMLKNIGEHGQLALNNAHVLIIGLGGLGNPVALYLAAAGVGKITLADGDNIEKSNLPRQILFSEDDINLNKADAAASKLQAQYPDCNIEVVDEMLDKELANYYVQQANVVLDCTDNIQARYLINQACIDNKTPLVIGAAIGFDGQQLVVDPRDSNSACYQCLYPETEKTPANNCQTAGVIGPVLAIIAGMQSLNAIKLLTHNKIAINQLSLFDGLNNQWQQFTINKQPQCPACGAQNT